MLWNAYLTQIISGWKEQKKAVARMIQYKQKLLKIIRQRRHYHNIEDQTSEELCQDTSMLQRAETEIIKMCQSSHFWKEIEAVNAGNRVPSTSSIHKLDPFLDKYGVLQSGWETFKIKFEPSAEASSFGFQISNHIKIDHQVLS